MLQFRVGHLGDAAQMLTRRCCSLAGEATSQPQGLQQLQPQLLAGLLYGYCPACQVEGSSSCWLACCEADASPVGPSSRQAAGSAD